MLKIARHGRDADRGWRSSSWATTRSTAATGAPAATTTACTSRPAITRASSICIEQRPAALRARHAGRAQGAARLRADPHLVGALHRRSRASRAAIRDFAAREGAAVETYAAAVNEHVPYHRRATRSAALSTARLAPAHDATRVVPAARAGAARARRDCSPRAAISPRAAARRLRARHVSLVLRAAAGTVVVAGPAHGAVSRGVQGLAQPRQDAAQRRLRAPASTATSRPSSAPARRRAAEPRHLDQRRNDRRLRELHRLGYAHSIETWRGGELWWAACTACGWRRVLRRIDVQPRARCLQGGARPPGRASAVRAASRLIDCQLRQRAPGEPRRPRDPAQRVRARCCAR